MIRLLSILALLLLILPATADDDLLSRQALAKPDRVVVPPPADPEVLRQGGDTIADAVTITLPYAGAGTTAGYNDDYDEVCPFDTPGSPDVVYSTVPMQTNLYAIDLFGSAYDTKVYVYDVDLNLVGCNDDHYPDYTSFLELELVGGESYYIVIDGYGGDAGEYAITVSPFDPCELSIPADAVFEGEPPLTYNYHDCFNNGCSHDCDVDPDSTIWQPLPGDGLGELIFHGVSGFYTSDAGNSRDTDWFTATFGPTGSIEVVADAEVALYVFELGPTDCNSVGVVQDLPVGPCSSGTMTVVGEPGAEVWLWTGPQAFYPPVWLDPDGDGVAEFAYVLWISGLESGPVATETRSWTGVKSLYQ